MGREGTDQGLSEEELLKKTEERMALMSDGKSLTEDDDADDDTTLDDDTGTDDNDAGDDDQAADDDNDDDSTSEDDDDDDDDADNKDDDEDAKDDGADDDVEVELSDAYYRAATNSGMTKEEIVEFMAVSPKLAVKTFAKMHDNMNSISQQFADFGRMRKKAETDAANDDASDNSTSKKSTYGKIDTAKLKEEYPDSEGLVDVLEQIQDQNKTMHDQMDELRKAPAANKSAAQDKLEEDRTKLIGTQIDNFFADPSLVAFSGTYGKTSKETPSDWSQLMPSEKVNRIAVIEQVEVLMEGAKYLGKDMEVTDALERAHLIVTQPIQEKMVREDIMKKVKKRAKGITLKPSSSKSSGKVSKKPKGEKDVVANAQARMDELFKRT